jgi:hypothetical protein
MGYCFLVSICSCFATCVLVSSVGSRSISRLTPTNNGPYISQYTFILVEGFWLDGSVCVFCFFVFVIGDDWF